MFILGTPNDIRYVIKRRMDDGTLIDFGVLTTKRARSLGEYINLPDGPDPEPLESKIARQQLGVSTPGHIWRIVGVEEPDVLLVKYVRPYEPESAN